MTNSLADAIALLGDAAEANRAAAREIYDAGRRLAEAAVSAWRADAELASLLGGERPEITVGVAVLSDNFQRIRAANGSPPLVDVPPEQDAMEFELHFAGGIVLDVLTSREPAGEGAIARFLKNRGEGIQQVEYRVSDVERAAQIVAEKFGVAPVYPQTRTGAGGTRINFFLARVPGGERVLIEFYETGAAKRPH